MQRLRVINCDKDAQTAEKGRPVTIQLDREVDVSRGCVLANKTELPVSKSFTVTVLWMDDGELLPGKEYFVKIGTKENSRNRNKYSVQDRCQHRRIHSSKQLKKE